MAEVSGLLIGAVGLVSIYSTCVQIFDTFQLGKDYVHDYQLAKTKFSLLRARLSCWGIALSIDTPGEEHCALRQHWQSEKEIVGGSLQGIKCVLSRISQIEARYNTDPRVARKIRIPLQTGDNSDTPPTKDVLAASTLNCRCFRKRATWAFRDKAKLDDLIFELNFLIDNLEKVAERLSVPLEGIQYQARPALLERSQKRREKELDRNCDMPTPPDSGYNSPIESSPARMNGSRPAGVDEQRSVLITKAGGIVETHNLSNDNEHLNTGDMDTEEYSVGLMGALDPKKGQLVRTTGKMTTKGNSSGIMGIASTEGYNAAQREAQQKSSRDAQGSEEKAGVKS